ncbi:FG-GAP repeat domain-containing protein [Spirosoma fluviale]|uniref:Repeat domain-containing protein n=1 Tax=Spirosoma fluviale TaxID=1597977 RepID=A0A286G0S3_9BACT|nr:VCBS repeat-containing protein [Spirosoma fluviale]SOD88846.1 Repeat domain-containing protein [Spirosoma fluviale]
MTSLSHYYTSFLAISALALLIGSCQSGQENDPLIAEGKRLAEQHCGSCHLVPAPELLDKESWTKHVLPAMASNLGLEVYPDGLYYAGPKAAISFDNWQKLIAYYQTLAPETLKPANKPEPIVDNWAMFSLEKPQPDTTKTAMTTLVVMDTIGHQLYTSDALRSDVTRWNEHLKPTLFRQFNSAAVDAQFFRDNTGKERSLFTTLGTMQAADIARGELVSLSMSGTSGMDSSTVAKQLPRPLKSLPVDVNKDGLADWVVCGFGHTTGGLYWMKQQPNHQFAKQPIKEVPGASQAVAGDFNSDGWPDLMVLFAHADEGIWLFLNDKKGGFTERNLLRFPSVYGSTSFQLVDFNNDGRLDILYTCGDNSDYSKVLKPYHGLYIYLNQGNFAYKQAYFYPINGCTKAIATDFDKDGDLDIVTIAFFADFKSNSAEEFLFFEQQKPLQFHPHAVPVSAYGRWICMDVNDIDHDGDSDIVLGNFAKTFIIQEGLKPTWDMHLPFVVLKNKTR